MWWPLFRCSSPSSLTHSKRRPCDLPVTHTHTKKLKKKDTHRLCRREFVSPSPAETIKVQSERTSTVAHTASSSHSCNSLSVYVGVVVSLKCYYILLLSFPSQREVTHLIKSNHRYYNTIRAQCFFFQLWGFFSFSSSSKNTKEEETCHQQYTGAMLCSPCLLRDSTYINIQVHHHHQRIETPTDSSFSSSSSYFVRVFERV